MHKIKVTAPEVRKPFIRLTAGTEFRNIKPGETRIMPQRFAGAAAEAKCTVAPVGGNDMEPAQPEPEPEPAAEPDGDTVTDRDVKIIEAVRMLVEEGDPAKFTSSTKRPKVEYVAELAGVDDITAGEVKTAFEGVMNGAGE